MIFNDKFKNALNCESQKIPPIWFMRQAGRYHDHYQKLRRKYSFEELCKNPELASTTAMGPIDDFDFDIAILFSDILFPLESLGLNLKYAPGPTFENFIVPNDIKNLKPFSVIEKDLLFQSQALKLTREKLSQDKSLVGFVGGPWTLLSFAAGIKNESAVNNVEKNIFFEKLLFDCLLPILRNSIKSQLESGAEIVYVFDTNAVQLEQNYFLKSYLPQIKQHLFDPFKSKVAYFSKNNAIHTISNVNTFLGIAGSVYNLESGFRSKLEETKVGFLQGNFSPESLRKPHDKFLVDYKIFKEKLVSLDIDARRGFICSLSHGVLPKTPEFNVKFFIDDIRSTFENL